MMDNILTTIRKYKGVILFAIIGVLFVASLPQITKYTVQYLIRQNGFPNATVNEFYLTPRGIEIGAIHLDGNGFSKIESISATGSWPRILFSQKLDRLLIKKIEIMGEITQKNQFLIAGWDGKIPQSKSKEPSLIPINQIAIDNIIFDTTIPNGSVRLQSRFTLQTNANKQTIVAHIFSDQKLLSFEANANGTLFADGKAEYKIDILNSRFDNDNILFSRGSGWIEYVSLPNKAQQYAGQIDMGYIKYKNFTINSANITLDSKEVTKAFFTAHPADEAGTKFQAEWIQTPFSSLLFKISAPSLQKLNEDFQFLSKDKKIFGDNLPINLHVTVPTDTIFSLPLKWTTNIELPTVPIAVAIPSIFNGTDISLMIPPTKFDASIINRIIDLSPYSIDLYDGIFDIHGTINISTQPNFVINGPLNMSLKNIDGTINDYKFKTAIAQMTFDKLLPLEITKPQFFSINLIETGMPIEKITGALYANKNDGVVVNQLKASIAGGSLLASPLILKTGQNLSSEITLNNIDLKYLFAKKKSDISAEGVFSGTFPITFRDNDLHISKGILRSNGGIIRYSPAIMPTFLQGDDARISTVRLALSDYRFDYMEIFIDGAVNGNLQTRLKANGKNPAFDERPIKLNLNIEGALVPAIKQALQPASLSDKIQKELFKDQR